MPSRSPPAGRPCAAKDLMTDQTAAIGQLLKNLDHTMITERHRLRRQLHELRKHPDEAKLAQWAQRVQASCDQAAARKA
ncbi:MAG TPA: hypothetical protein DIT18_07995, partial [Pseudomonas sp.]|nr:hypothetical protein [Pseudomonas sp.]